METSLPGGEGIYVEGTRYHNDEGKETSAWYWDELKYIADPEEKLIYTFPEIEPQMNTDQHR